MSKNTRNKREGGRGWPTFVKAVPYACIWLLLLSTRLVSADSANERGLVPQCDSKFEGPPPMEFLGFEAEEDESGYDLAICQLFDQFSDYSNSLISMQIVKNLLAQLIQKDLLSESSLAKGENIKLDSYSLGHSADVIYFISSKNRREQLAVMTVSGTGEIDVNIDNFDSFAVFKKQNNIDERKRIESKKYVMDPFSLDVSRVPEGTLEEQVIYSLHRNLNGLFKGATYINNYCRGESKLPKQHIVNLVNKLQEEKIISNLKELALGVVDVLMEGSSLENRCYRVLGPNNELLASLSQDAKGVVKLHSKSDDELVSIEVDALDTQPYSNAGSL